MSLNVAKVVLVTGANSGIGYETVKALLQSAIPYHILVGSRTLEKSASAIRSLQEECTSTKSTLQSLQVDLDSDASIEAAYEEIQRKPGKLDVLVNNAGATFDLEFVAGKVSLRECFMKAYNGNVAGTNVLTWTLMPLLLASPEPRLLFIAGLAGQTAAAKQYFPTPPQPAGWPKDIKFETIGYRCSKTALNMLMLDWNHKLKADGVKVWAVGPGMLATNLGGLGPEKVKAMLGDAIKPASEGGDIIRRVVEGERDADVGKIVVKDGGISDP